MFGLIIASFLLREKNEYSNDCSCSVIPMLEHSLDGFEYGNFLFELNVLSSMSNNFIMIIENLNISCTIPYIVIKNAS